MLNTKLCQPIEQFPIPPTLIGNGSGSHASEGHLPLDEGDASTVFQPMWLPSEEPGAPSDSTDVHAAFRGRFRMSRRGMVEIRLSGSSWFLAHVDGVFMSDGPPRFVSGQPEYDVHRLLIEEGEHVIAVHIHGLGITTRLVEQDAPPFLAVQILDDGQELPVVWRCKKLGAFLKTGRRLGCVLGWVEWCDTRALPEGWKLPGFDDLEWDEPEVSHCAAGVRQADIPITASRADWRAAELGAMRHPSRPMQASEGGELVNMSIIRHDPPMNFLTRQLASDDLPPEGRWWRFELDRVRLGRPEIHMDLPVGALVQIAYAEELTHGRVSPYLKSGSGDNSCMMDTWIARGGPQTFTPLHPKGGRFLELHVLADPAQIRLLCASFIERCYYPEECEGGFSMGDPLLDRIWKVGVQTLQSCTEDAITDNPSRERGQWLGDAVGAGMDILAVAYSDWRPLVRGLRQAAQCAAPDGLIPAIFPGTREFLPSFSIQWVSAILRYHQLSGDAGLLTDLYPAAARNIRALSGDRAPGGLRRNRRYWNFVDWGYTGASTVFQEGVADEELVDPALSLFYLGAIESLERWASWLGREDDAVSWGAQARDLRGELQLPGDDFSEGIGFHEAVLRLKRGLYRGSGVRKALDFVCGHILSCFPNDPQAPRLAGTSVEDARLITPFFLHFALPVLVEYGRMDFVLGQIRTCWGWMLGRGATTWYEVFDPRWSHCHQWSGCPTWILSRYVLGLHNRFDIAPRTFDLRIFPGTLTRASGRLPCPDGVPVDIRWARAGDRLEFEAESDSPFGLQLAHGEVLPPRPSHRLTVDSSAPLA